jgi:DNA-binding PadR family transcriptional regulator
MEKRDWIEAEWGDSELGRKAKFYRLTRDGREQLRRETAEWKAFVAVVSNVLLPA